MYLISCCFQSRFNGCKPIYVEWTVIWLWRNRESAKPIAHSYVSFCKLAFIWLRFSVVVVVSCFFFNTIFRCDFIHLDLLKSVRFGLFVSYRFVMFFYSLRIVIVPPTQSHYFISTSHSLAMG